MDNLKKQLKNLKVPVTNNEWGRLEKKLKSQYSSGGESKFSDNNRWLAVAATLLLLVSAYLVFQWPADKSNELVEIGESSPPTISQAVAPERINVLTHRKNIQDTEPIRQIKRGLIPYFASLPNGEKWLVQLSLIRDSDECIAEIHSINDRPFKLNMKAGDDECLMFSSEENTASLQLVNEGKDPVLLLVFNQTENGTEDEIALELRPIH